MPSITGISHEALEQTSRIKEFAEQTTVVSRSIDPMETAVVSVCMIHGGTQPNVIPDAVELQLTTRAFSDKVRDTVTFDRVFEPSK